MREMKLTMGERFREAREDMGLTAKAVSEKTGVQRSVISNLENDVEQDYRYKSIVTLAKFYGVTTDYLLCLTDVKSPDTTLQAVCEYTGLSEDAVKLLCGSKNWTDRYNIIISKIIEYGFTNDFLFRCNEYLCSKELLFEPVKFGTTQELIEMKEKLKEDYHAHVVFSETMAKVQFLDVTNLLRDTLDKIAEQEATHAEKE